MLTPFPGFSLRAIAGPSKTARQLNHTHSAFASRLLANVPSVFVAIFVTITMFAIFIPLNPDMPGKMDEAWLASLRASSPETPAWLGRLDSSWMLATNAAVARHLRFGKQIVFTYGPYGSILFRSYHPATDRLMILGSLLLGASYVTALLYLAWGRKPYIVITLVLFCATFPSADALFLSYPFLIVVCALQFVNSDGTRKTGRLPWWQMFVVAVVLSALGLLPLVKGSLLLPVGVALALVALLFLRTFALEQALPLLLVPILSMIVFWVLADQTVWDLPAFLRGTGWLISGYTDAMSVPWSVWPGKIERGFVLIYLLIGALLYVSFLRSKRLTVPSKWLLSLLCAAFLFVAFKHGFVRADHMPLAFGALVLFILSIGFLTLDSYLIAALSLALVIVIGVSWRMDPRLRSDVRTAFGYGTATRLQHVGEIMTFVAKRSPEALARTTYKTARTYTSAWEGIRLRTTRGDILGEQFAKSLETVRSEHAIPQLAGTVDIYTYAQVVLLASNNVWNPRPVFQSYSAYTSALARINEQHLRGRAAPDWIVLEPTTIDGRLPAGDDGPSWPALLDNYAISSFDGRFAFLHKKPSLQAKSDLNLIYQGEQRLGATVTLPEADGPLYAEIDIRPTLPGRVLSLLYRPPQLNLTLTLEDGETKNYRIISNLSAAGFILSPLVSSAEEFAALAARDQQFEKKNKVVSVMIAPSYGGSIFWSGKYLLTLKAYHPPVV